MRLFASLIWVFVSPGKVFDDIKQGRTSWWKTWLCVSGIYLVIAYFLLPVVRAVNEFNPGNLPPDKHEVMISLFERAGMLILLIDFLARGIVVAGLSYVVVSILSEKAKFKEFFTIYLYGCVIALLAEIINVLVVRTRGIETLQTPDEAQFSVGLAFLAPTGGLVLKALFSSVEFFGIWSLAVVAMGLIHVFDMPRKHAIYCAIALWLIGFVGLIVNGLLGGMNAMN